jgi:stage II sporulation protein D
MTRRLFAGSILASSTMRTAERPLRVRVQGRIQTIDLEPYTAAVLTGEGSVFQSNEALKAMAVAIRTYALHFRGRHTAEGFDLCNTTHCQRYDTAPPNARVLRAAQLTAGEILLHQGKPALTYYTLDCGGQTEDVRQAWPGDAAPYLTSRSDPHCLQNVKHRWHWETSVTELTAALNKAGLHAPAKLERITITQRTQSGRASNVALGGPDQAVRISASSLRFAVGRTFGFQTIQSDLYEVGTSGARIVFKGTGSGHGVGLCQRGADHMGLTGSGYRDILAFYFPGLASDPAKATTLPWRRVYGERIALFTTQPDQDAPVLAQAERLLHTVEARTQIAAPRGITIRIYPTVATFIAETGEPGWIAAHAENTQIHLQPRRILENHHGLESTLRHELTHVLIDAKARPGLPVWFREGLVEHLSGARAGIIDSPLAPDRDLRQTANEPRARAAYADALVRVAALVQRYGETTVFGWLTTGLPREVTNASNKPPATNSK